MKDIFYVTSFSVFLQNLRYNNKINKKNFIYLFFGFDVKIQVPPVIGKNNNNQTLIVEETRNYVIWSTFASNKKSENKSL